MKYFVIALFFLGFAGSAFAVSELNYDEKIIPPPLKQMKMGIKLGHIICEPDKIPTWNVHFKPACVFPDSETKLLTRGWAKLRLVMPASGDPIKELELIGNNELTFRILGNLIVEDNPPPNTLDEKREIVWEYAQKYHPGERFLEYAINPHQYHYNVGDTVQFDLLEWGNYFDCWNLNLRILDKHDLPVYEDNSVRFCLEPDGKPGWFGSYSMGEAFDEFVCNKAGYYRIQISSDEIFPATVLQNFACLPHESEAEIMKQSFANQIFSSCGDDDDCIIRYLQQFSQINDRQSVLDTIDDLITVYDTSESYCHPNAHHVGEFLMGYVDGNLAEAAKYVDSRCASGILHGVVENTIGIQNILYNESIESVDVVTPCEEIEKRLGSNAKMECVHGMGHSLTKAYDYDVINAVKKCDQFETERERFMCQGGMFMENLNKYWDNEGGAFDENDMLYPCNQIDERHAALCYRYHGTYFLMQNDYDPSVAFGLCEEISKQVFVEYCYKGVGSYMANKYSNEIAKTVEMCQLGNKNYQAFCVKGAIESITRFVSEDLGNDFCEKLSSDFQENCYKRMNELIDSRF